MTGDQQDMLARLRAVLPTRWFPDSAPVLDGLLSGLASGWSWAYQQLQYVKAQTRIATATDVWLDIIAHDFFGNRLVRRTGQERRRIPQSDSARVVPRTRNTRCDRLGAAGSHGACARRVRTSPIDRYRRLYVVERRWGRDRLRQRRRMGQSRAAISVLHHGLSSGRQRHCHGLRLGRTLPEATAKAQSNMPAWRWYRAR